MSKELLEESATLFLNLTKDCSRSISQMQKLKSEILTSNLFTSSQDEREEIILLIDAIIWEEAHAAEGFRRERKENLMEIAKLGDSIQEREAKAQP